MAASRASSRRATCRLLDEVGGAGEEDAPAVLDEGEADGGGKMALAAAGRPEQEQVGALGEPGVAGGEGHDLRLGDHRHGVEVEGVEGLAGRQAASARWRSMRRRSRSASSCSAIGGEEAGGGPALLIGAVRRSCGQTSLMAGRRSSLQHDPEAGGVDAERRGSCGVPDHRGAEEGLVAGERRELDRRRGGCAPDRARSGPAGRAGRAGGLARDRLSRQSWPARPRSRGRGRVRAGRP